MSWLREVPTTLASSKFWEYSRQKQDKILFSVLYKGYQRAHSPMTEEELAYKISYLRRQPVIECLELAVALLAEASKGYLSDGPLGPRPVLISAENLYRLCGASTEGQCIKYRKAIRKHYSHGLESLMSNLTASNPGEHRYAAFSNYDLARGIVLPRSPKDAPELMALLAADMASASATGITLIGTLSKAEFYRKHINRIIEDTINYGGIHRLPRRGGEKVIRDVPVKFEDYLEPTLSIKSRAVFQWLNHFFPKLSKQEILAYFSRCSISKQVKMKFACAYLAAQGELRKEKSYVRLFLQLNNVVGLPRMLRSAGFKITRKNASGACLRLGAEDTEVHIESILRINPLLAARNL